jgi:RNA polymerase sigma factor (sigma-70 family)
MRPSREPVLSALMALLSTNIRPKWAARVDAEDAIMDAVLRVLEWEAETPEEAPDETAAARKYAARAVQNILIDRFRERQRQPISSQPIQDLPAADPPAAKYSALLEISEQLLDELPTEQRDLLRAYFAGSDYFREESIRQRLTPNAARVRIHRLLQRLRKRGNGLIVPDQAV